MKCTLTGALTISAAADVRAQLLQALAGEGALELDTTQVTDVDAAGLQLLLAACKSASQAGIPVQFPAQAQGDVVETSFKVLGLENFAWSSLNHG
jgi:anti-anti-sigma regulatory factor